MKYPHKKAFIPTPLKNTSQLAARMNGYYKSFRRGVIPRRKVWGFIAFFSILLINTICLGQESIDNLVATEANYILSCQYMDFQSPAYGAINNIFGESPTWIVPRENAMAILGLIQAQKILKNSNYLKRANLSADYMAWVQDEVDGSWVDQYSYGIPVVLSKSPTQTAEVMIAFYKLGFSENRYTAMKKGAQYLMACQDILNKGGIDDGLICGGKDEFGAYRTLRWASDNSYAYLALRSAEIWAEIASDIEFAEECRLAYTGILAGINGYLYVTNPADTDYGAWHRAIDENGVVVDSGFHEWINYAPQMLDLPAQGTGVSSVGDWIHNNLQEEDGACVWNNAQESQRKSPGYSFQAGLCWVDLGQQGYLDSALNWAEGSGLWQNTPAPDGSLGGWIDWVENGQKPDWWLRFIDTSFYAIAAFNGGYNFNISDSFKTGYYRASTPALADLDADGRDDIILTHFLEGKISAFSEDGRALPGWPITTLAGEAIAQTDTHMPAAVSDINGDGKLEVIAGVKTTGGKSYVAVFDNAGNTVWRSEVDAGSRVAVDDLNNDAKDEVVAAASSLYVFDYAGNILNNWPNYTVAQDTSVALADIDKDGRKDIVFSSSTGEVYAVDYNATALPGWPAAVVEGSTNLRSPAVGDLNNDAKPEIVVTDIYNNVYVLNNRGKMLRGWPQQLPNAGLGAAEAILANMDSDPAIEIVASTWGNGWFGEKPQIHIFNFDASLVNSFGIGGGFYVDTSPCAAGVNSASSNAEIFYGIDEPNGQLKVSPDMPRWPKPVEGAITTTPAIGDINGDGKLDVAVGSADSLPPFDGHMQVFFTGIDNKPQNLQWPLYRRNNKRTACYQKETTLDIGSTSNEVTQTWRRINFSDTYTSGQIVIAGMETFNAGDPAGLRMKGVGVSSMMVKVEEEQSKDAEVSHGAEAVGYVIAQAGLVLDALGKVIGETGKITIEQNSGSSWSTVKLGRTYINPVVLMQVMSNNESQPCHMRLRSVSADSFQCQIEEWDYLDGAHLKEAVGYIVLEAGVYKMAGRMKLEAGITAASHLWKDVSFRDAFSVSPVVLSQCQTYRGAHAVVTRHNGLGPGSFKVRLQEEEANDGKHNVENIGYIVIGR